jgi:HK97 family phage major capsid protein
MKPNELRKQAKALYDEATNLFTNGEIEAGEQKETEADALMEQAKKAEAVQAKAAALREPVMPGSLPGGSPDAGTLPPPAVDPDKPPTADEVNKAISILRYKGVTIDDPTHTVMRQVYAGDYRQLDYEQTKAFALYLRRGDRGIGAAEDRILKNQMWPIEQVKAMLSDGLTIAEIKSTMVEGIDVLGGYAVPPERAAQIIQRMQGLTAVRAAGAMVIVTASKLIEWVKLTGGGARYTSGMRGTWGHETQSPAETNFTLGAIEIPVHLYTYKVPMSVSLIEDAQNIVEIFTRLAAETLSLDEDEAFLIGDGANKPRGILPNQLNADSLTEVNTGDADDITLDGLKKLRRGIDSQYRRMGGATFVGNNQSGEDIELFKDGMGQYFFDTLTDGGDFLGGKWRESEALPDPAANVFPLIYGNFGGYGIVERLGFAVQRYNDSNTGINTVQYQVRRRLGGRVLEPWRFAIAKCAV